MSLELSAASLLISKPDRILRPRNQVESSCQGKTNKQKQKLSRIFQKLLNLRREKSEFRDFKKGFDKNIRFSVVTLEGSNVKPNRQPFRRPENTTICSFDQVNLILFFYLLFVFIFFWKYTHNKKYHFNLF